MKTKPGKDNQQEFLFAKTVPKPNARTVRGRIARAHWWFSKMRLHVDNATTNSQ